METLSQTASDLGETALNGKRDSGVKFCVQSLWREETGLEIESLFVRTQQKILSWLKNLRGSLSQTVCATVRIIRGESPSDMTSCFTCVRATKT